MLYQKYDDEIPIFLIKPFEEIKDILNRQIVAINQSLAKDPKPTSQLK